MLCLSPDSFETMKASSHPAGDAGARLLAAAFVGVGDSVAIGVKAGDGDAIGDGEGDGVDVGEGV